ncbi:MULTISPECIES: PTS sugar transporter subunit IIB [Enterococcus]|uniref:PTS system, galactosamine-specific IIB component n=1 Tax=Candidatus Enterococcus ferrettii TaxID=2815324 RepID=A0ABV0ELW0_9ENTE|nr:PTS sugar transporter subunit IIB [Enterococcus sp. 665A]MBO1338181.1 PTS sugar transporter subunit IIB [Enterococcus sp. 665A]
MSVKIKLVRVDNRLLHATVALNWNSFVNANFIAVVDPSHIDDPFLAKVLQLSFPKKNGVGIFSVEQLINFLEKDREEKCNLMIIFKNLEVLREAVEKGFVIAEVQLPYPASRVMIKQLDAYFSPEEIEHIRYIQEKGTKFFLQTAPHDSKDYSIFKQ